MNQPIRLQLFPITTRIEGETLTVGGCNLAKLAEQYGTPLYVYDAATMDAAVRDYRRALQTHYPGKSGITYAGKAFLSVAVAQWTQRHGLWVDCTGLGEMRVAAAAGVPREHVLVHGVNKSRQVLTAALAQAGTIVVDNLPELNRLSEIASHAGSPLPNLWLRFRPGRAVDTHVKIQTGQEDSKFGMSATEIVEAANFCRQHGFPLTGLHFHLGSKFHDPSPLVEALERTLALAKEIRMAGDWTLCIGGGWGVAYHEDDLPQPSVDEYVRFAAESVVEICRREGMPLPRLQVEPGRGLVARAGVAIYRVGGVKRTPNRRWLLLDGGMADNPRFALYQARYTALPVRRPARPAVGPAWLAGPYCESGDILIENLPFPDVQEDELVAIPVSGAYQLSMASNYNGATRPAALWLEGGKAHPMRERETPDDLIRRDMPLPGSESVFAAVPFHKYQALGNDYLVVNEADLAAPLMPEQVRRICHPHYGVGADGIALDVSTPEQFAVRIFNPDGSEAEISGNGVRIFARYLFDSGRIHAAPVAIWTKGRSVTARVRPDGRSVTVDMGTPSFDSRKIPVAGPARDVVDETIEMAGETLRCCAVTVGNPHCVVLREHVTAEEARRLGPLIENHPVFPNRTNVQFMEVLGRNDIRIEIWERGAGYTLASGSSSCAAAAAAHRLGLCDEHITVHMPGGEIDIAIGEDGRIRMSGPVAKVWDGYLSDEAFGAPPGTQG